jgi:hypothetical protein
VGRHVVEEASVVRDDHDRAAEGRQELLEPADRENVEVVRRLVEQHHVGGADQHPRQEHTQLEAAGQRAERIAVPGHGNAETLEHVAGSRLERVAVVHRDAVFQLREPGCVRLGSGEQCLLLLQRQRDPFVARHRDLEDRQRIVYEAILPEDAEP